MPDFPETSYSLIARLQDACDGPSWVEFLAVYRPIVYRMVRRRGLQDADAEDVVQQIFLSITKSIDGWRPVADQPPFRAWLTTIARNAIVKALTRRPRDRATGSTSVAEQLDAHSVPRETESEILMEERRELVRWAVEQIRYEFSDTTWQIFWQTSIEGMSVHEVARATGRSVGAIYVARHRVISRLKEKVTEVSRLWALEKP